MSDNQPTSLDSILRELHYSEKLTFNKDGTTTSEFNWAKFEAALNRLLIQERLNQTKRIMYILWDEDGSPFQRDDPPRDILDEIAELQSSLTKGEG